MKKLTLFAASAIVALFLGFGALRPDAALEAFGSWGYLWIAAAFVLFCVFALRLCKPPLVSFVSGGWRRWELGVAGAVIVASAGYCIASEPWRMRIVMDEPVLMATSYTMAHHGATYLPSRAYHIGDDYLLMDTVLKEPTSRVVDKRPILYPFLTSLLHQLRGFSFENGSLLNNILCGVFFLLLYLFLRSGMPWPLACSGLVCVAALPLMPWVSNGAGMELTALVMLVVTALVAQRYLKAPDVWSLSTLCLCALLLVQSRYEMVLFVPVVGLIIAWSWWQQRRIRTSWIFFLTPLLFVPYAWQQRVFTEGKDPFDLTLARYEGVLQAPEGAFSWSYVWPNLQDSFEFFFNTRLHLPHNHPNSFLLSCLGLFGVLYFFYAFVFRRKDYAQDRFFQTLAFLGLGFLFVYSLYMLYAWGGMTQRITYRFSLPFSIVGIVACCWALSRLRTKAYVLYTTHTTLALIALLYTYTTTSLTALRVDYFFRDAVYTQLDWVRQTLHENPLYILDIPFLPISLGGDALSSLRAASNKHKLEAFCQAYPERPIYVFSLGYVKKFQVKYINSLENKGFLLKRIQGVATFGGTDRRVNDFYRLEGLSLTPEEQSLVPPLELLPRSLHEMTSDPQKALGLYLLP